MWVQLLACWAKTNKKASWWKGKFALFQMPATWMGGGQTPVQKLTPHLTISGEELL